MSTILAPATALHKERNPAISLPPSRELGELMRGAIGVPGRPVWRVASLAAPRLGWGYDPDHAARFRSDAWTYLETASGLVWEQLPPTGRKQLLKLQAAVLRDIWGGSEDEIAERAGYSDARTARERIREGRELWAGLPAWPWRPIVDAFGTDALKGGLPAKWWELPRVIETYEAWATDLPDSIRPYRKGL